MLSCYYTRLVKTMENVSKCWYFIIDVREGLPGCADNDTYQSEKYDSFEECYREYITFSPPNHWYHLRNSLHEYIINQSGEQTRKNIAYRGLVNYRADKIVEDLGITDEQFDLLIDEIKNERNTSSKRAIY